MPDSIARRQRRLDQLVGPHGTGAVWRDRRSGLVYYAIGCGSCHGWTTRAGCQPDERWQYRDVVEAWERHLLTCHLLQALADSGYTGAAETET